MLASDIPDDELAKHPYDPAIDRMAPASVPMEPVVIARLRRVQPASSLHLALVEVVRRQYEMACKAADRADKESIRADQEPD